MKDGWIPDLITHRPQIFFWTHGMRRTGNALANLRYWLWRRSGGGWQ